jgi:hypothetical protein
MGVFNASAAQAALKSVSASYGIPDGPRRVGGTAKQILSSSRKIGTR